MIVPRIGALLLLIAYGFAAASLGRVMYVTAREGYNSWLAVLALIAPAAILGIASALLVLWRKPLGVRLAVPLCIVLVLTAIITFFELPPVGGFLDDYQAAALERGVDVPPYLEARDVTPAEYVESKASDVRSQGALGAIIVVILYGITVLRGSRKPGARPAEATARSS
jgi:hypothetical protein